ncbi:MAG TPA: EAL domain-containing protein [Actinomycetota bacterium]|nr:EAL domain-containing protein [Actinomycetota bacterium]
MKGAPALHARLLLGPDDPREELRRLSVGMRRVRWVGIAFAAVQFLLYRPPPGIAVPFSRLPAAAAVISALLAIQVASLWAPRARNIKSLENLVIAEFLGDTVVVLAVIWLFSFDQVSALWALLVVPVIRGAMLGRLKGAMLTWAGTGVVYAVRELWAAATYPHFRFAIDSVTYRMGIILIVATSSGLFARNLRTQLLAHREAQAESERRADLLRIVASAGRDIHALETEQVLAKVVQAAVDIGFEGAQICLFDGDSNTYRVMHPLGFPGGFGPLPRPVASGVSGLCLERQRTIVVDDYASWPGGLAEVKAMGFKTMIATPVWSTGRLVASLVAGRRGPGQPHDIESLELLAMQAGAALGNATQYMERRSFQEQLQLDALTQLPNRVLFLDRLKHCLERKPLGGGSLAVLFIDLDHFKKVNDSFGHDTGDDLLRAVAERLRAAVRSGDTVARFGGDEFTILLEDLARPQDAREVATKILEQFQNRFRIRNRDIFISASIGISLGTQHSDMSRDFMREADLAMYQAKQQGGGRGQTFQPNMIERAHRRGELESEIRTAVDKGQFSLRYQPLISLVTGRMIGVEALVRWEHPLKGTVLPAEFIPLAEETGLIVPLGRWVLEESTQQARGWRVVGDPLVPIWLCVNLSVTELRHPHFIDVLDQVLDEAGLEPSALILEVTESVMMREDVVMTRLMDRIRALGVRLSIDDFGRGYSSLSYLKRFPVDIIKIDKSFVAGVTDSVEDQAIIRSVITLAQELSIQVVAEGVENKMQLDYLRRIGCDIVQGFYVGTPLTGDEVPGLLERPLLVS